VVDKYGQTGHRHDEELHPERVVVVVVRGTELGVHEVDGGVQRHEEKHFHHRVVERHERREQVEVARREHHRKHYLRLA